MEYLKGQREHLYENAYARRSQPDIRTFGLLAVLSLRQQLSQHKISTHTVGLNKESVDGSLIKSNRYVFVSLTCLQPMRIQISI